MRVNSRRHVSPTRHGGLSRRAVLALFLLLSAGAAKAAWPSVIATPKKPTASRTRAQYVAIPHPGTAEWRRRGAYVARKHSLPLIAEPGVVGVVIKEFRP